MIEQRRIGEISDVFNGKTPSKADQRQEGFPVLKVKDVDAVGRFRGIFESFVDTDFAEQFQSKQLVSGDTLILNAAHNADYVGSKTFFARDSLGGPVITGEWTVIRPDPLKADPRYVRHYLESGRARHSLRHMVKGIHLYPKDIARCGIPLPPLPEQRRIAAILDKADALRQKRREAIAKLDQLLQSVFLEMFGDPVTNPISWSISDLGEICDVRDGTHDSPKYVAEGKPLITSKNLVSGSIDITSAKLISQSDFEAVNRRSKVTKGDILMPMIGTIGNPVLVESEPDYAIKNVALIRMSEAKINTRYLLHLLQTHYFDWVTAKRNRGGTQKFVSLKDLRTLPIPMPPENLQVRYAELASAIKASCAKQHEYAEHLETLFSSLQQRAFAGQL